MNAAAPANAFSSINEPGLDLSFCASPKIHSLASPKLAKFFRITEPPVNFLPTRTRQKTVPLVFFTLKHEMLAGRLAIEDFWGAIKSKIESRRRSTVNIS